MMMLMLHCDLYNLQLSAHLRHPNEVGGAYWIFGLCLSLLSLPLAATYYQSNVGDEAVAKIASMSCSVLLPSSLLLIVVVFLAIKKEYRKTFWTTERGKDVTMGHMSSSEDMVKALVFVKNRMHWKSIEDDVEEWVRDNWERWMEEEPDWLDDNMKARIPPHMIPNDEDRKKVENLQSARRRSSALVELTALSGRHSMVRGVHKVAPEKT